MPKDIRHLPPSRATTMSFVDQPFTDLYLDDPKGRVGESFFLWKRDGIVSPIPPEFHQEARVLYGIAVGQHENTFSMEYKEMRLRAQLLPSTNGVTVVLRRQAKVIPSLGEIGLPPAVLATMMRGDSGLEIRPLLSSKVGLVVLCGETDSGKSTTLAVLLREILDLKPWMAMTIEDPAELPLAGQHKQGYCKQRSVPGGGFSQALREALRMNPDVILLGEIRDEETAATALSAAITGHLVVSTVHAGNISQAIRRLIELGSQSRSQQDTADLLANCLYCCIHQRLVRVSGPQAAGAVRSGLSARRLDASVLFSNRAVQNLIRTARVERLDDEIAQQKLRLGGSHKAAGAVG